MTEEKKVMEKRPVGRPKKNNSENIITVNQVENKWKKIFSSSGMGSSSYGGFINGYFRNGNGMFANDPYLLNQRIKQLKSTPSYLSREEIESALLDIDHNELGLRKATTSILNMTYPLYKSLLMYEGILSYKNYVFPKYVPDNEKGTPRYKSDCMFTDMWLKKLNIPYQFRRITFEVLQEGKKAYYIRQSYNSQTGKERCDYVHFENLPTDWFKIIKKSTDSYYVCAFNFAYFWQSGTSLGQFPPIFTQYYNQLMGAVIVDNNGSIQAIDKSKTPKDVIIEYNSDTMEWFYWKELPLDEVFIFSFDETHANVVSPFVSLLLPAQDLSSYSLLQQQLLSVPLYSIILGEIPLFDDKSSTDPDAYKLSPDATTLFESIINSRMPPGTSYAMTPAKSNTMYKFSELPNSDKIYLSALQQLSITSGTGNLMALTEKPSVAQVASSKSIEKRFIDRVYSQYMNACNILLRKMYEQGDLKYQWQTRIWGSIFSDDDEKDACLKGLTLGQKELFLDYLALSDKTLLDANSICDFVDSTGIYDKFQVLVNSYSTSGKDVVDKKNGRPSVDENNIQSDETASSIDSGQNTAENKSYSLELLNNVFEKQYICPNCGKAFIKNKENQAFCSDGCKEEFIENIKNEELED